LAHISSYFFYYTCSLKAVSINKIVGLNLLLHQQSAVNIRDHTKQDINERQETKINIDLEKMEEQYQPMLQPPDKVTNSATRNCHYSKTTSLT